MVKLKAILGEKLVKKTLQTKSCILDDNIFRSWVSRPRKTVYTNSPIRTRIRHQSTLTWSFGLCIKYFYFCYSSSIRQCICPTAALRPYPGDVSRSLVQFILQMWISTITNIVYYIQVTIVRKMKYPILLRKICSFFLLFYRTTTVSQVIFFKNFARQRNEKKSQPLFFWSYVGYEHCNFIHLRWWFTRCY